jgi:hypothetical protein
MKKIRLLFLLLLPFLAISQVVPADASQFENIQLTNNATSATAAKVVVQEANGVLNNVLITDFQRNKGYLPTGLIKNGALSINAVNTTYDLSAGIGIITNFDDPYNPTSRIITFPAVVGKTPAYLNTSIITYVGIQEIGTSGIGQIIEQAAPFTVVQNHDLIPLGAVIHSNLSTINVVNNITNPSNDIGGQMHAYMDAIGAFNLTGNKYSPNGGNLALNRSAGALNKRGSNFILDWKNPNQIAQIAASALTFRYRTQNGTEGTDRINLDPTLYDLNNVLTSVAPNKFTIQTVYLFQSGTTRIQYGQNVYNSLAEAESALSTRSFVVESNIAAQGVVRAYVIVKNTATNLADLNTSKIIEAGKFGGFISGGAALTFDNIVAALGYTPENLANKGILNGYASLDGSGKVPLSQINDVLLGAVNYKGTYDASTNTPAIPAASSGNKGFYYVVSTGGTQQSLVFKGGDWIISNGSSWGRVDNNSAVTSVNTKVGAVTLTTADIADSLDRRYQTDTQKTFNDATSSIQTQLNGKQASGSYETAFAKNTAFNKNFGTTTGTVGDGAVVAANTAKVSNATHTGDVTGSTALTITNGVVSNAKLANMLTKTYKGRTSASTGVPEDVSATALKADLSLNNVPNTDFTSAVAANTAKEGITTQQASDITTNNAKVGITTTQASNITANNAKISFDSTSSTRLANTSGTNTGDQVLTGLNYAPSTASANYIQNGTTQQTANLNISGSGVFGSSVTANKLTINNPKDGTWTTGEVLGTLDFYGNDTSGNGAGVKNYIRSVSKDTFGAAFDLTFGTSNGLVSSVERLRIANTGESTFSSSVTATSLKATNLAGTGTRTVVADASGNLTATTTPASGGYKVYTALLTQSGTAAPTATVLENTLGFVPDLVYSNVGVYALSNLVSGFTLNKTVLFLTGDIGSNATYGISRSGVSQVRVISRDDLGNTSNGLLVNATVEIRVYN